MISFTAIGVLCALINAGLALYDRNIHGAMGWVAAFGFGMSCLANLLLGENS